MFDTRIVIVEEEEMPIILVAPHGPDDDNTAYITNRIAKQLGCFAVINNGFKRNDTVDAAKDLADCNNIDHCKARIVYEEFLEPIVGFVNRCMDTWAEAHLFYIHGMNPKVKPLPDVVVGYGAGRNTTMTCTEFQKNVFLYLMRKHTVNVYSGKPGGSYSGASQKNMNQFFRQLVPGSDVSSMQLEILRDLRSDTAVSRLTADTLTTILDEYNSVMQNSIQGMTPTGFDPAWEHIASNVPSY